MQRIHPGLNPWKRGPIDTDTDVDVDDMTTWPPSLQAVLRSYHGSIPQSFHTSDLALPDDADIKVHQALSGHSLLAFHCTRLMDHEAEKVKTEGLRAFGTELFDDRIREAFNHGAFSADIREELLKTTWRPPKSGLEGIGPAFPCSWGARSSSTM